MKLLNITNTDMQTRSEHDFMLHFNYKHKYDCKQFDLITSNIIDLISMNVAYVTIDSLILLVLTAYRPSMFFVGTCVRIYGAGAWFY